MNRLCLVLIFIIISIIGCKETDKTYIDELIKISDFINYKEGWKYSLKDQDNNTYIIQKENKNKYSELKFNVDNFKEEEYIIIEYHFSKEKINNGFKYFYFSKDDTLCSYIKKNHKKTFLFGKYYYLYEIERFKNKDFDPHSLQVTYYYKNKDSLINVKGNNLPELPKAKIKEEASEAIKEKRINSK
jgi:hypothetical protein